MIAETFTTISYVGQNGGTRVSGRFVEVDDGIWIENNIFYFTAVSRTATLIQLADVSRGVTVDFNLETGRMTLRFGGGSIDWSITGVSTSILPLVTQNDQRVVEGTTAGDVLVGGSDTRDVFVFDSRAATGKDTIEDFGDDDLLVTTSRLSDRNGNGVIEFGRNRVLDLADDAGTVRMISDDGQSIRALEFDGSVIHEGVEYFVYSRVGSDAGVADLNFLTPS